MIDVRNLNQDDVVQYHLPASAFGTDAIATIRRLMGLLSLAARELVIDGHDAEAALATSESAVAAHDLAQELVRLAGERLVRAGWDDPAPPAPTDSSGLSSTSADALAHVQRSIARAQGAARATDPHEHRIRLVAAAMSARDLARMLARDAGVELGAE